VLLCGLLPFVNVRCLRCTVLTLPSLNSKCGVDVYCVSTACNDLYFYPCCLSGPVTKWSQGPLLPQPSVPAGAALPPLMAPVPVAAIPVFVDAEFAQSAAAAEREHQVVPSTVLSVRRQLDALKGVARNPLARHTQPAETSVPAAAPVSAAVELPVFTTAAPPPEPTVMAPAVKHPLRAAPAAAQQRPSKPAHSSVTAAGGFSIFCDDVAPAHAPASPAPALKVGFPARPGAALRASSFTIYEPGSSPRSPCPRPSTTTATTAAPVLSAPSQSSAAPGFAIFVDESFQAPATPHHKAAPTLGFSVYESPVVAQQPLTPANGLAAKAPAFAIFEDEPLSQAPVVHTAAATTPGRDSSASSSPPQQSASVAQESTVTAAETGSEEHDQELHAILDSMMCLDNEDGTINTRLAKRDIDMMFCSPTIHRAPPPPATRAAPLTAAATATAPRPPASGYHDENSFVLRYHRDQEDRAFERTLFRGAREDDCEVDQDEMCSSFMAPPVPTVAPRTARKPLQISQVQPTPTGAEEAGPNQGQHHQPGVLQRAVHRPFGMQLSAGDSAMMSAVKDLSAIKEVR
jgi:hypothetical protein